MSATKSSFLRRQIDLMSLTRRCYDPDASLLGRLRTPEGVSNLTFGGPKRNHLFIATNSGDVYSIRVTFTGVKTV